MKCLETVYLIVLFDGDNYCTDDMSLHDSKAENSQTNGNQKKIGY